MKVKTVDIQIYQSKLIIFKGGTPEKWRAYFRAKYPKAKKKHIDATFEGWDEYTLGMFGHLHNEAYYIGMKQGTGVAIFVHEMMHLIARQSEYRGFKIEGDGQEWAATAAEFLTSEFINPKGWVNHKSKKK